MEQAAGRFEAAVTKIVDRASKVLVYAAVVTLPPLTVLFVVYMSVRKLGLASWNFVEEWTGYWLAVTASLALAYTLMCKQHIRVEFVTGHLPERVNHILEIVVTLLAVGVVGAFVRFSLDYLVLGIKINSHNNLGSEALLWPFYLFVPIGYGLLGVALLLHLFRSVLVVRKDWLKSGKEKDTEGLSRKEVWT